MTGCGGVDKADYLFKNRGLFLEVPDYPGARLLSAGSWPHKRWRDSLLAPLAPVTGYSSTRTYRLPRGASPRAVIDFYDHRLGDDWQTVAKARARYLSTRRGDAYLHILVSPTRIRLSLDHDCYKGGSAPSC